MAQEHQEYIHQKVNPILENLVTQLLLERPEHLPTFMIKWLSEHTKTPTPVTGDAKKITTLKQELEELQAEVKQLEAEVGDVPAASKPEEDADESEEEDDDDDGLDTSMPPPAAYLKQARGSVSAEAYGMFNPQKAFKAPVYEKTEEQMQKLRAVLEESFLFSSLEKKDLDTVIKAMQQANVPKGQELIKQGDDGDYLYVVEKGQMDCYKKTGDENKKVKECKAGDAFGELALLYNCPRAASVVAYEDCVLWQLDRESFNLIVRDATSKRRERYEEFLKGVAILNSMDAYERNSMCDALIPKSVQKGETIVEQGTHGDEFYIVEEGECVVEKVYIKDTPAKKVNEYKSGDYFGELALLHNEPRAASVIAKTDCRFLTLKRKTFKQLLGPLEQILTRHAKSYT